MAKQDIDITDADTWPEWMLPTEAAAALRTTYKSILRRIQAWVDVSEGRTPPEGVVPLRAFRGAGGWLIARSDVAPPRHQVNGSPFSAATPDRVED